MQNNCNSKTLTYAGFWVRLCAYVIDTILVMILLLAVRLMMFGIMSLLKDSPLGGNLLFHFNLKDIVIYICQVAYFILFTAFTGTTPGKRLLNLRVVKAGTEEIPTFWNILYRETVGRFLCTFIMCIGYIMVGVDKEKRGLHDILCDTRVIYGKRIKGMIRVASAPVPPMTPPQQQMQPPVPPVTPPQQQMQPPVPPEKPQWDNNAGYRMVTPDHDENRRV